MTADSCQNILLRRTLTRRSGLWAQERRQVPAKRCGLDRAESLALLSTMRVSIIIPCYNTERWVGEAIQSAMAQRREIAEIIVVDDGSSDKSLDVIKSFPHVVVVTQKNGGPSVARNTGLSRATGDYVVLLDADDRLQPDAVANHLTAFGNAPDASLVYGSIDLIDENGSKIGENLQPPARFDWRDVLYGKTPSSSQAMYRHDILRKIGGFDPSLRIGEDFPLYLRLGKSGDIVCHGDLVAEYRKHAGQLTKRPAAHLDSMLESLRAFRSEFDAETQKEVIWADAERYWRVYWGQWIPNEIVKCALRREWRRAGDSMATYLRHMPDTLSGTASYAAQRMLGK